MRRAMPYVPINAGGDPASRTRLPIDAPTQDTRNIYHEEQFKGLITRGSRRVTVPIQAPWAGEGATFPAFPKVQSSKVAPNEIEVPILVAINDWSPISHRNYMTGVTPPRAINPRPKPAKVNVGKRGTGGAYTIPAPRISAKWPTSSEWLAGKMIR